MKTNSHQQLDPADPETRAEIEALVLDKEAP